MSMECLKPAHDSDVCLFVYLCSTMRTMRALSETSTRLPSTLPKHTCVAQEKSQQTIKAYRSCVHTGRLHSLNGVFF